MHSQCPAEQVHGKTECKARQELNPPGSLKGPEQDKKELDIWNHISVDQQIVHDQHLEEDKHNKKEYISGNHIHYMV